MDQIEGMIPFHSLNSWLAAFFASTRMLLKMHLPGDVSEIGGVNHIITKIDPDGTVIHRPLTSTTTESTPAIDWTTTIPSDNIKITTKHNLIQFERMATVDPKGYMLVDRCTEVTPILDGEGNTIMKIGINPPIMGGYIVSQLTLAVSGLAHADVLIYNSMFPHTSQPILKIIDADGDVSISCQIETCEYLSIQNGTMYCAYIRRRKDAPPDQDAICMGLNLSATIERLPGTITNVPDAHKLAFDTIWSGLTNDTVPVTINEAHLIIDTPHMKRILQVDEDTVVCGKSLMIDLEKIVKKSKLPYQTSEPVRRMLKTMVDDGKPNLDVSKETRQYHYKTMKRAFRDMFDVFLQDTTKVELVFTSVGNMVHECIDGWKGIVTRMHLYVMDGEMGATIFEEELSIRDFFLRTLHDVRNDEVEKVMTFVKNNLLGGTILSSSANIHLENYVIAQSNFGIKRQYDALMDEHREDGEELLPREVKNNIRARLMSEYTPEKIVTLFREKVLTGKGSQLRREKCHNLLYSNVPLGFGTMDESTAERQFRWLESCHNESYELSDAACKYLLILMNILHVDVFQVLRIRYPLPEVSYDWPSHLSKIGSTIKCARYVCIKSWVPRADVAKKQGLLGVIMGERVIILSENPNDGWVFGFKENDPAQQGFTNYEVLAPIDIMPNIWAEEDECIVKQKFVPYSGGYLAVKPGDVVKIIHPVEQPGIWVFAQRLFPNPGIGWISDYCLRDPLHLPQQEPASIGQSSASNQHFQIRRSPSIGIHEETNINYHLQDIQQFPPISIQPVSIQPMVRVRSQRKR